VSAQVVRLAVPSVAASTAIDWSQPLAGKKILVTGASRGIGESIAEVMARDGAQVICLDVPQAKPGLDEVAKRLGAKALALDIGSMQKHRRPWWMLHWPTVAGMWWCTTPALPATRPLPI
jgi:3-oxoacyl-[acyl-carrier protein] reductase